MTGLWATGTWTTSTATIDAVVAAGGAQQQAVTDVGGGKLIATATDADGNLIGLLQMPVGEPA